MRSVLFAAVGAAVITLAGSGVASAHEPGRFGYIGNGGHDLSPHWHKTLTPYGPTFWYGNGPHDLMPHNHTVGPFGGVRSYSYTPFGPTKSYNGFPGYGSGYYGGLGGYGGYYGGYGSPWGW